MVPIGKWEEMKEDDHGLYVSGRLFQIDTDRAKSVYAALKEGELDGLSIGFQTKKWEYDEENGIAHADGDRPVGGQPRDLPGERSGARRVGEGRERRPPDRTPDFEGFLRDAGFTKRQAQVLVADGYEHFLRDAGFTKDEARSISSRGYRQVRRDAMPSEEACGELLALMQQRTAIFSGEQRT